MNKSVIQYPIGPSPAAMRLGRMVMRMNTLCRNPVRNTCTSPRSGAPGDLHYPRRFCTRERGPASRGWSGRRRAAESTWCVGGYVDAKH